MRKRHMIRALPLLLLLSLALTACGERDTYTVEYPAEYTAAYFYNNYVQCDPNLIHLRAAENSAGKHKENAWYGTYYAIKDVPIEEYVCYSEDFFMLDPTFSAYVARNKTLEMPEPEILTWTVSGAELYWQDGLHFRDAKGKMTAVGEKIHYETLAEVDGAGFQSHLREVMAEASYRENGMGCNWSFVARRFRNDEGVESDLVLNLRVRFAEYENIVWDGLVVTIDGGEHDYYVYSHVWTTSDTIPEGFYQSVFVPLPEEIAKMIP